MMTISYSRVRMRVRALRNLVPKWGNSEVDPFSRSRTELFEFRAAAQLLLGLSIDPF